MCYIRPSTLSRNNTNTNRDPLDIMLSDHIAQLLTKEDILITGDLNRCTPGLHDFDYYNTENNGYMNLNEFNIVINAIGKEYLITVPMICH